MGHAVAAVLNREFDLAAADSDVGQHAVVDLLQFANGSAPAARHCEAASQPRKRVGDSSPVQPITRRNRGVDNCVLHDSLQ